MAKKGARNKESAKKASLKKTSSKGNNKKLYAFIAAFFTIIGFLIAIILKKDDKYVMYYAKHGLILFIAWAIVALVGWIPFIGWLYGIFIFILWIITWINALSGQEKRTFIISDLADKLKL